jgi:hypothetical protein
VIAPRRVRRDDCRGILRIVQRIVQRTIPVNAPDAGKIPSPEIFLNFLDEGE